MRILLASALLAAATPALADEVTGKVLAYDRVSGIIVLDDKTVFSLGDLGATPVEGLVSGDEVTIVYQSAGEDGFTKIDSIVKAAE